MPNDGNLIIGIEAPQLQRVVSGMNNLIQGVEKCTTVVSELTRTMNSFSSASVSMASRSSGAFSQAQKDLSEYKKKMLDVAAAGRLNGNAATIMTEKYNSLASVVNNATRAVDNKINADKNSIRIATEQAAALAKVSKEEMALQKALGSPRKVTPLEDTQRTIRMNTELNAQKQAVLQVATAEKQRTAETKAQAAAMKLAAKSGDYSQARNSLSAYNLQLKDAIASGAKSKQELAAMATEQKILASSVRNTEDKFRSLTSTGFSVSDMFKRMGTAGQVAFGSLVSMAVRNVTMEIGNFISSSSLAARTMDGVVNSFAAGAGGFEGAGRELAYVRKTADEMGIAITSAYEPYSKFMTSFTRSGGSIASSRQIFSDISAAAVSLHLTAEQTGNVYVALEQMANKGTVQMEELKRQLGNNLPGAFELAAESMGVTTAQLTDMMKKGQVMSADFLPKFAAKIREVLAGSLPLATRQAQAEFNRLSTDTFDAQVAFGKLINEIAIGFIPTIRGAMQGMTGFVTKVQESLPTIQSIATAVAAMSAVFGTAMVVSLVKASAATGVLATAQAALAYGFSNTIALSGGASVALTAQAVATDLATLATTGLAAAGALLKANLPLVILGTVAAAIGFVAFKSQQATAEVKKATQAMSESQTKTIAFAGSANLLSKEYIELKKNANKNLYEQNRLSEVTDELNSKYPGLISLLDKEALAHGKITRAVALQIAEKQKLAQVSSLMADQTLAMDKLDKNRKWLSKSTENTQEANIRNETNDKLKTAIRQYNDAIKVTGNTKINSSLGGGDNTKNKKNSGNGKTEPKTAWDNLNAQVSAQEELIQSNLVQGKSIDGLVPKYVELKNKQESVNKAMQNLTATGKDGWETLNAQVSQKEAEIRSNLAQGQSIEKLIPDYIKLKQRQDEVNTSMQALTATTPTLVDNWKKLEENLTKAEQAYKSMLSNSTQYTSAQIKEQESVMMGLKVQVQYNKKIEDSTDLMNISSRAANQLADTLVDDLFTALDEGETVWSRFQDAGLSAFKALATDWVKKKTELMGGGFQAGWAVQSLYDKSTGQSSSIFDKLTSGLTGAAQGAKGEALGGTKDQPSGLSDMLTQVQNLSSAAGVTLPSALTTAASSITSLAAPATTTANALGQTATSALGMSTLSSVTTAMLGVSTTATPVFTAMATAITAIGTAASAAAIGMAELAVATAAAAAGIGAPAAATATTTAIVGSNTALAASYSQMALVSAGAKVIPHAKGGVVSSPTTFPMQGGNIGVAGEAGTEVIAPARRMSNGDLGVGAVAPNVTVNNYANAAVEVIKRPDNDVEVKVTELNAMLSSSRSNKGMSNAQNRLSTQGRRIG